MPTKTRKVTQTQAEKVLQAVAEWMGKRGYGQILDYQVPGAKPTDKPGEWFLSVAPTGEDAAYRGEGPMLRMDWDWPGQPTPTILLEGGPYDWAIEVGWDPTFEAAMPKGVRTEPYAGYALCLYRED